jgi:hypothetical protein
MLVVLHAHIPLYLDGMRLSKRTYTNQLLPAVYMVAPTPAQHANSTTPQNDSFRLIALLELGPMRLRVDVIAPVVQNMMTLLACSLNFATTAE